MKLSEKRSLEYGMTKIKNKNVFVFKKQKDVRKKMKPFNETSQR
jgi:hypothetical protein